MWKGKIVAHCPNFQKTCPLRKNWKIGKDFWEKEYDSGFLPTLLEMIEEQIGNVGSTEGRIDVQKHYVCKSPLYN